MSAIKERILGAITIMSEEDALRIWEVIKFQHGYSIDAPTDDEIAIINAYKNGDENYAPHITHEQLKKELGL